MRVYSRPGGGNTPVARDESSCHFGGLGCLNQVDLGWDAAIPIRHGAERRNDRLDAVVLEDFLQGVDAGVVDNDDGSPNFLRQSIIGLHDMI